MLDNKPIQRQKAGWGIIVFAFIEVAIGSFTISTLITSLILGSSTKPPAVFVFVLITSSLSLALGIGILKYNIISYYLLLYFSSIIILSKILIFTKIINLSGALEILIPQTTKNIASVIYHALLMLYFIQPSIRKRFLE